MRKGTGYTYEEGFTGGRSTVKCPGCGVRRMVSPYTTISKKVFCSEDCKVHVSKKLVALYKNYRKVHHIVHDTYVIKTIHRYLRDCGLTNAFAEALQGIPGSRYQQSEWPLCTPEHLDALRPAAKKPRHKKVPDVSKPRRTRVKQKSS